MKGFKTSFITGSELPLVIEPLQKMTYESSLEFLSQNRSEFEKILLKKGGILFRGFPISGADQFNQAVESLGLGTPLNYIGGDSPRDKVKGKVYTSTEAPPSFKILLHNEMSFIQNYPKHIYFYCDTPSYEGGATILGDARRIYNAIDPEVRLRFSQKKLRYISNFFKRSQLLEAINRISRGHKTWMEAFETDEKAEVERRCQENGFGYRWMPQDWLQVYYDAPAVNTHPLTNDPVWFNQAHLYDFNPRHLGFLNWLGASLVYLKKNTIVHEITYGDGSKIERKDLYHVMDILDRETVSFPWQKNDFLVLDNILAMHGRAPFVKPRRILVSMTR